MRELGEDLLLVEESTVQRRCCREAQNLDRHLMPELPVVARGAVDGAHASVGDFFLSLYAPMWSGTGSMKAPARP